jgi:hypothetical protein
MSITLGDAARTLKISKPTLSKAISKGQLSASRNEDGSFAIDPSELMRWWEGVRHRFQPQTVARFHEATPTGNAGNGAEKSPSADPELTARLASLEAEITGLKNLLTEVRDSRAAWQAQAERLALPAPSSPSSPGLPWWKRLMAG